MRACAACAHPDLVQPVHGLVLPICQPVTQDCYYPSHHCENMGEMSEWVQDPVSVALVACVHLALLSFGWPPGLAREVSSSDLAFARRRVCPAALIQRRARCSGFCASLSALRRAILASLPEREIASIAPFASTASLLPHNVVMGAYRTS